MRDIREIYREAFADALAQNLGGDRLDELTPEQAEQARGYAREYAEGEVAAAQAEEVQGCPVGVMCECCGTADPANRVVPIATTLGPLCLTACSNCRPIAPRTAMAIARLVAQHRAHRQAGR